MSSKSRSQKAFETNGLSQTPSKSNEPAQKAEKLESKIFCSNKCSSENAYTQPVSRDLAIKKPNNNAKNDAFYFLNIFKPSGITSFDVIYKLRKILKIKKIGHSGTLDPLADGVMQVGVGKATRLLDYLGSDKKYVAKIRFGYLSSTCDAEGDITFFNIPKFTLDELLAALKSLNGQIEQIPPAYSAVKVGGKKLCDLARQKEKKSCGVKKQPFDNFQNSPNVLTDQALQCNQICSNPHAVLNIACNNNKNALKTDISDVLSNSSFEKFEKDLKDIKDEKNSLLRKINDNFLDIEIPKRNVTIYEAKLLHFATISKKEFLSGIEFSNCKEKSSGMLSADEDCLTSAQKKSETLSSHAFEIQIPYEAEIEITCSKGTYIRSFAVDLAQKLGTGAYLTALTRTRAGNFDIKDSIQIGDVNPEINALNPCNVLDLPKYELNKEEYKKVLNGVAFAPVYNIATLLQKYEPLIQENISKNNSIPKLADSVVAEIPIMLAFENNLVSIAVLLDNKFVCKKVFK